ncbi:MAG: hypothetical protein EA412_11465 [Chitinophagaceae bacterium]|nr:MAG: hypothetical protein EA412_11465 [Chitinophagaceae bacterium]
MFEILLIIYLFSGLAKSLLLSAGLQLPIDLTLLSGVLMFAAAAKDFIFEKNHLTDFFKDKLKLSIFSLLVLFYLWALFSLLNIPDINYPFVKAFYFLTIMLPVSLLFFRTKFNAKLFIKLFILFSFLFSQVYFWLSPNAKYYLPQDQFHLNYIVLVGFGLALSFKMGVAALISLYYFKNKILAVCVSYYFFFIIYYMAARGTVFILLPVFLILIIAERKRIFSYLNTTLLAKKVGALIVLQIVLLIFIQIDENKKWTFDRANYRTLLLLDAVGTKDNPESIASYLQEKRDEEAAVETGEKLISSSMNRSVFSRVWHIQHVIEVSTESFSNFMIGKGFGTYAYYCCGEDLLDYPHNILLEILYELGIIGLIIFLAFIALIFIKVKQNKFVLMLFILCALFLFLNAMKSSSIVEIRDFFTFAAIIAFMEGSKSSSNNFLSRFKEKVK